MQFQACLVLLCFLFLYSAQETRYYSFKVAWFTAAPDGFKRPVLGINGQFPGPTILTMVGDRLVVNVSNQADQPITIHWHGMMQNGTLLSDGAYGVNQCGIMPGDYYIYNFTTDSPGTYWYHSHYKGQYTDGLKGGLVVKRNPERYNYKYEHLLQLSDWYHNNSQTLFEWEIAPYPTNDGNEPVPDATLINDRSCGNEYANCNYQAFSIAAGTVVRLRIVSTASFAIFNFDVSDHDMVVVEVDGVDVQPTKVKQLRVNCGQRYSVLISGNQRPGSYWIQAMQSPWGNNPTRYPIARAILQYDDVPSRIPDIAKLRYLNANAEKSFQNAYIFGIDPTGFVPLDSAIPPKANKVIPIDVKMMKIADGSQRAYINGTESFHLHNTTVFNYLRAQELNNLPKDQNMFEVEIGDVVDLIILNENNLQFQHPFHLHGHRVYVLALGALPYDPSTVVLNEVNPLVRDTFSVDPSHFAVVRFVADNPGIWFMHCHIDWHLMIGMSWMFVEGQQQLLSQYGTTQNIVPCKEGSRPHKANGRSMRHRHVGH